MKKITYIYLFLALALFGCSDLNINNENQPDIKGTLNNPAQYPGFIAGAYNQWWDNALSSNNDGAMWHLAANADAYTPGAANWGIQTYYYSEGYDKPRIDNTVTSSGFHREIWYNTYGTINTAKNLVYAINVLGKVYTEQNQNANYKILANCYLQLGMYYSDLALLFDKAFIITEYSDVKKVTGDDIQPAINVRDTALMYLDRCIAICESKNFNNFTTTLPNNFISTSDGILRFANFMAARTLAYFPRTAEESKNVDWTRVANYLSHSLDRDLKVNLPLQGWFVWSMPVAAYRSGNQWFRVGPRILKMMAPNDPGAVWPTPINTNYNLPEINSPDKRLKGYFAYNPETTTPSGGLSYKSRFYSSYALVRFTQPGQPSQAGELTLLLKAESDLLLAEALLRTNQNKAKAIELINETRKNVGGLDDISVADATDYLLKKVFYERFVELSFTYTSTPFYDRRRVEFDDYKLTPRSFRELPVPLAEIQIFKIKNYDSNKPSFGGQ